MADFFMNLVVHGPGSLVKKDCKDIYDSYFQFTEVICLRTNILAHSNTDIS